MFPAILHALAFLVSLNVQDTTFIPAGAWLPFFIAGCAALLYNGKYEPFEGALRKATLLWLLALTAASFILNPVISGSYTFFLLATTPTLALCLRREHIRPYCYCFGGVIALYAGGLFLQMEMGVVYDNYNLIDDNLRHRYAWPLLDPNNAAVIIDMMLIPLVWLGLFKRRWWTLIIMILIGGMVATGSKTGVACLGLAIIIMTCARYGAGWFYAWLAAVGAAVAWVFVYTPERIADAATAFATRYPLWDISWQLMWVRPWLGLGMGRFGYYYQHTRTETYTGGSFAHNDLLQLGVEMGIPFLLLFCALVVTIARRTWRGNMVSGLAMLAMFIASMVEFQFYTLSISMLNGLALGFHIINQRPATVDVGLHSGVKPV